MSGADLGLTTRCKHCKEMDAPYGEVARTFRYQSTLNQIRSRYHRPYNRYLRSLHEIQGYPDPI